MDCPFIVCMTYAFHTPDKLCFVLDLMNGGDLHYHLSQHGVFSEEDMRFYAGREGTLARALPLAARAMSLKRHRLQGYHQTIKGELARDLGRG